MLRKYKSVLILSFLLLALLPWQRSLAATPSPENMDFIFTQSFSGDQVTIVGPGKMYDCGEDPSCQSARELSSTDFFCKYLECIAHVTERGRWARLEIQFSDGQTRQSNVFGYIGGLSAKYAVTIRSGDLLVQADSSELPPTSTPIVSPSGISSGFPSRAYAIALACACLLLLVVIVVIAVVFVLRRRKTSTGNNVQD